MFCFAEKGEIYKNALKIHKNWVQIHIYWLGFFWMLIFGILGHFWTNIFFCFHREQIESNLQKMEKPSIRKITARANWWKHGTAISSSQPSNVVNRDETKWLMANMSTMLLARLEMLDSFFQWMGNKGRLKTLEIKAKTRNDGQGT